MSFGKCFRAKTSKALLINVENCAKHCEKSHQSARNCHVNHVGVMCNVNLYLDTENHQLS